jgi:hypothetical protein
MRTLFFLLFLLFFVTANAFSEPTTAKQGNVDFLPSNYKTPNLAILYEPLAKELRAGGLLVYFVPLNASGRDHVETDEWWKHCPLSRTVDDIGIMQARTISRAMQNLGLQIGNVESSDLCMTLTSTTLIMSNPSIKIYINQSLNPYEIQKKTEPNDRTLKATMGALFQFGYQGRIGVRVGFALPASVAPHPVIAELQPGDSAIFRPHPSGEPELVARLSWQQWDEMSKYITYLALTSKKLKKR